jgi:hypothetical protein
MKRLLIICLAIVTLLAVGSSAEAGRRKDRRAAKKGGGGVYAGAYQRKSSSGYGSHAAVAATPVTAASYAAPTPASPPAGAPTLAAACDLTITEIAAVGNALSFMVKNVGTAASPECRLEIIVAKPQAAELEAENVRVLPLEPNQSVRIRIAGVVPQNIKVQALVDPDRLVAEANEQNNELKVTLAAEPLAATPPTLVAE